MRLGLSATPAELDTRAGLFAAAGTEAATWLNRTLAPTAPLAYCILSDQVAAGLRGTRPLVGVWIDTPVGEQLALLGEALPEAKRIGLLYRSDNAASKAGIEAVRRAAAAIEALMARGVDVVWTSADASLYELATTKSLLLTSPRKRVPVFGFSASFVRSGALLGLSVDAKEQRATAGKLAVMLLAKPASGTGNIGRAANGANQPVGSNAKLIVNLVVAENIDIKLPKALLDKAAQVQHP